MKNKAAYAKVVMLAAQGNIADGVKAMKLVSFDYIVKGEDNQQLVLTIGHAMEKVILKKRVVQLADQESDVFGFNNIVGASSQLIKTKILAKMWLEPIQLSYCWAKRVRSRTFRACNRWK